MKRWCSVGCGGGENMVKEEEVSCWMWWRREYGEGGRGVMLNAEEVSW
jgi:hypothetical protein